VTGVPDDTPVLIILMDPATKKIIGDPMQSVWIYGQAATCLAPGFQTSAGFKQVVAVLDIGYWGLLSEVGPARPRFGAIFAECERDGQYGSSAADRVRSGE
jgi:hypothetical protein